MATERLTEDQDVATAANQPRNAGRRRNANWAGNMRAAFGAQRDERRPMCPGHRYLYKCGGEDWRELLGQYWLYRHAGYSQIGAARRAVQSGKYERGHGQSDVPVEDLSTSWTLRAEYDAYTRRLRLERATDKAFDRAMICRRVLGPELYDLIAAGFTQQATADLTGRSVRSIQRLVEACRQVAAVPVDD